MSVCVCRENFRWGMPPFMLWPSSTACSGITQVRGRGSCCKQHERKSITLTVCDVHYNEG